MLDIIRKIFLNGLHKLRFKNHLGPNCQMRSSNILFTLAMLCMVSTQGFAKDPETNNDQVVSLKDASIFFAYVADRVHRDYVEPTKNAQLLEGALNGMLTSLDPHSAYLSPQKYKDIRNQTEGKFAGIGLEVTVENGFIKVISAMEDSPGQRAGLMTGDLIIMIDHQPVFGLSTMDAMKKLRGPAGSIVNLVVRRSERTPFELKIKRDIINIKPIKWRIEDKIGYIRVINFTQNTGTDLRRAIQEIFKKFEGDRPLGFVIDLRNNAGGLFDQGIEVADAFLDNVEIVSVRGRDPKKVHKIMASEGDMSDHLPLVVLINGGSASASEIVAGALQDHKRAVIVGTKSFGKGSVQNVIPMTNGGAIKLTTALYYTPSGRSIQKKGIMPDIVVEQQFELKALDEAQRLRESNLKSALKAGKPLEESDFTDKKNINAEEKSRSNPDLDQEHQELSITPTMKEVKDYQLLQALNILKAGSLYGGRIATLQKK